MKIQTDRIELIKFIKKVLQGTKAPFLNLYDKKCYIAGDYCRAIFDFFEFEPGEKKIPIALPASPFLIILEQKFDEIQISVIDDTFCDIKVNGSLYSGDFKFSYNEVVKWESKIDKSRFLPIDFNKDFLHKVSDIFEFSLPDITSFLGLGRENAIAVDSTKVLLFGGLTGEMRFFPLGISDLVLSLPPDTELSFWFENSSVFLSDKKGILFQVAYRFDRGDIDRILSITKRFLTQFQKVAILEVQSLYSALSLVETMDNSGFGSLNLDKKSIKVSGASGWLEIKGQILKEGKLTFLSKPVIGFLKNIKETEISIWKFENVICFDIGIMKYISALAR